MTTLGKVVQVLIYSSVIVGAVLLFLAAPLVPGWLLASLSVGEAAYAAVAVAVWRGIRPAFAAATVLAVLVLLVSLPQPEHYAFAAQGELAAFAVFALGSVLQVGVLVLAPLYLYRTRERHVRASDDTKGEKY